MYAVPRTVSPKFPSVSLYDQLFSRYCTFYDFTKLKFQSVTKFLIFGRPPKNLQTLYSHMPAFPEICLRLDKTIGVAF